MKAKHDLAPRSPGKTRITIRIDTSVLGWFRNEVRRAGGGSYQTMINDALREHIGDGRLEKLLRRVVREELKRARWPRSSR